MIPFIIGAAVGYITSELMKPNSEKKQKDSKEQKDTKPFYVFIRSNESDKYTLTFYTYEDAKKVYDYVVSNQSVRFKTILDNSEFEQKLYDDGIEKGWTVEDGMKRKSDRINIIEVAFGKENDEFESKTF